MIAVSLVPSDARFSLSQARVLRLLERFDEARSLLRSLQTQPIDPGPLAAEWAALMLAQGKDEQALVHYEHQVELGVADANVRRSARSRPRSTSTRAAVPPTRSWPARRSTSKTSRLPLPPTGAWRS